MTCDNAASCIECFDSGAKPFLSTAFLCADSCQNGEYEDGYTCRPCVQSNCELCADASACTQCLVGFHLETDDSLGAGVVGECVPDCGDYQYETWPNGPTEGGVCENCVSPDCI